MNTKRSTALTTLLATAALAMVLAATTDASLSPATASFTLRAGTSTTEVGKIVTVPATPPSADIEIAIDTTSSMGPSINQAKADALNIVNGVQGVVPDTQFAVVQFKDFCTTTAPTSGPGCSTPGGSPINGDYPEYAVQQSMTASAAAVQTAINGLVPSGGGDLPEAYNLVFQNSSTPALGGALGWRSGTRKFVIVIGDASPHGAGSAGIPGCTDTSADPNGLSSATTLAGMNTNQRTLFMVLQTSSASTTLACYQGLASRAFTGSQGVPGGTNLATQIVSLINAAFATVNDVHLEVASASPAPATASWITLPPALGPVAAPGSYTFGPIGIAVPLPTPAGTYTFDLVAKADGVDIGHQIITVVVPQKMMTLTPATDSNPIGTSHTVTAHVFDTLGPFVGDTVNFSVTGGPTAVPSSGTGTSPTNATGDATFTFSNTPPNPGTNTITATDGTAAAPALFATATAMKTWVNAPPDCSAVTTNTTKLWPPNHKLHTIAVSGATDPEVGDSVTLVIDGITQDEPVNDLGDGNTAPDGFLTSPVSNQARVRSERSGLEDGRVYRLHYTATDTHGGTCTGFATVGVPHDQGKHNTPIDSAPPSYNSLAP